ncbi:Lrp/AsnC family transcriptional regulator [Natronosalvus rutilus]|uniref:Lrp/AsnC family transcriptional regulator n=1 Tax=Natronosalvus rutilus TaxID=2953753 RepID=A0A9E7NC71_9EURY|nr:Lrp/AsnC family transcriptional regulator [Natronosalvus rutilus]UTF54751.1 Lrp/AsnC family transcriptional regulator [Natronosalvus rutilus]
MAELDEIDYGILHLLQEDARHQTPVDMAEHLPVSAQTVRNRIEKLEEAGVIEGYAPSINYEKAGFPIRLQFICTAPPQQREELAKEILQIDHMVRVDEMLSATENLRSLAVTKDSEEINTITEKLHELGLTIEREQLQRYEHNRPFNHFGEETISEE